MHRAVWGALTSVALVAPGCTAARPIDPLNLTSLGKPPLRIGVTELNLTGPLLLPKNTLFEEQLAFYLDEPLSFDLMTPRQIRVHLGTGRLKFAMLKAADYAEIAAAGNSRILAVPINERGTTIRRGLVITGAKSPIRSVTDLKGLRFHFMPRGDVLNEGARGVLQDAGIGERDTDRGVLGLGFDTYHISSLEVAKSVVIEGRAAGVIDASDYERWPQKGGSVSLLVPSQDEVRVLAETVPIPEGPVVVSEHTSPELANKVADYLINRLSREPVILATMGCRGFASPIDAKEYDAYFAMRRRMRPAPQEPASEPLETAPGGQASAD